MQTKPTKKELGKPRLMSMRDLIAETGMSRNWVYQKLRNDDTFPKPVKLGPHTVAWRRQEFEAWLAALPRAEPTGLSAVEMRRLNSEQVAV